MTALAPTLQAYFTTRLVSEFGVSVHTLAAYRDTWRLLLRFIAATRRTSPQDLDLADLDADVISGFLTYLVNRPGFGGGSDSPKGWESCQHRGSIRRSSGSVPCGL
ncbi:hypothetical protein [Demequina lutea]|uniref:Site-specific recombinase XerD n=1 Tax=Demequina lutea TaxID=431489 RepID=A0A7Y9Z893_9MICO|nr:hypothetical protein [Demequina lutea]NYI40431.1 site-specific recombinase XerD [Demequina lutea]